MCRPLQILTAVVMAAGLAGCVSHANQPAPNLPSRAAATVEEEGASPTSPVTQEAPAGRASGIRSIRLGAQQTVWVERCPTHATSPLREPCSMTRIDNDSSR